MSWDRVCILCDKEREDSSCTVKGYWKRGEHRFDTDICITCFDGLRNKLAARKALDKFEEVLEDNDPAEFDKLLDNSDVRHALLEHVLPVWSRNKYRDVEQQ